MVDRQMTNTKQLPVIPMHVPTHDNTKFSDLAYCVRLYGARHVRGLRPRVYKKIVKEVVDENIGKRNMGMEYGNLLHKGLATYYKTLMVDRNVAVALHASLITLREAEWDDDPKDFRTRGRAQADMQEYAIKYGTEPEYDSIVLVETAFDCAEADGYRYGGKLDLIMAKGDEIIPQDHKTTSRWSDYYFENYTLSPQMIGYDWGARQLSDKKVPGVNVTAIVLHKNETVFYRKLIPFNDRHLDQWKRRNIARYKQVGALLWKDPKALELFNPEVWTPNFENCIGKYGPCAMFRICNSLPENFERKLQQYWEEGIWDWTDPDL